MHSRAPIALALVLAACPAFAADPSILDVIPEDAAFAVIVRNFAEACDKADAVNRDVSLLTLPLPPPGAMVKFLITEKVGLKQGFADKRSVALVVPDSVRGGSGEFGENSFVWVLPITDRDTAAKNFNLTGRDLVPGKVLSSGTGGIAAVEGYLFLGGDAKAVRAVVEGRKLGASLNSGDRNSFERGEMLVHWNPQGMGAMWTKMLETRKREAEVSPDAAERAVMDALTDAGRRLKRVSALVRLDGGLGVSLKVDWNDSTGSIGDAVLPQLLTLLRRGKPVQATHLPLVHPIALAAFSVDAAERAPSLRKSFERLLADSELGKALQQADRDVLASAVERGLTDVTAVRLLFYRTLNAAEWDKVGLLGGLVVLDSARPAAVLGAFAGAGGVLGKLTDGGGEPTFVYTRGAETVDGVKVDTLAFDSKGARAGLDPFLSPALGTNWHTLRLAPAGNTVVIQLGSDTQMLRRAMAASNSSEKGLASHKAVEASNAHLSAQRRFELHASAKTLIALTTKMPGGPPEPEPIEALTSLGLTVVDGVVRLDVRIPSPELKVMIEAAKKAKSP